jgi:predicted TIM-barrel fold metal-dependent hydrolase
MSDPPEVVADMFDRFVNLWVDISIREYDIAPQGDLDPEWEKLFLEHTDRITIGSDTWVNGQWDNYEKIIAFDRHWLAQLPPEVARKIAFDNAKRLFD